MKTTAHWLLPVLAVVCLTLKVPSFVALVGGALVAIYLGNPYVEWTKQYTQRLLAISIIGLGAGMNISQVAAAGYSGLAYTIIGLLFTVTAGYYIGKFLGVERDSGVLISVGTAICGGSAIAAMAPVLRAKPHSVSVALGTVFTLNALALLIFPPVGHWLGLGQTQFGLWSALAIHDTSSVVGSTLQFGPEALEVGTTVKLARAFWIVPMTLVGSMLFKDSDKGAKIKWPWFILGFLLVAILVTQFPDLRPAGELVERVAKRCMVLVLFLVGTNLTWSTLKAVGIKPFILGIGLWALVSSVTLWAVYYHWIR